MKSKKNISAMALVLCLAILMCCVGCSRKNGDTEVSSEPEVPYVGITVKIGSLKGANSVALAPLMSDSENGYTQNRYVFNTYSQESQLIAAYKNGDIDIAMMSLVGAGELYFENKDINMIAIGSSGGYQLVEKGDSVNSFSELKGKSLGIVGQGGEGDCIWRFLMRLNSIDPDDGIAIRYFNTDDELAASLIAGEVQLAVMSEGSAASVIAANPDSNITKRINLGDEWNALRNRPLPSYCYIASNEFVTQSPSIVRKTVAELEASAKSAASNRKEIAALCGEFGILEAELANELLKSASPVLITGEYMHETSVSYYSMRMSFNINLMGGKQPPEEFYFQ